MSEPPKPESRSVESNQTVEGSVENIIKDLDHVSSESVVCTSTVESKISGHDKKVAFGVACVTESTRTRFYEN
jgi:hypothetical protein